MILILICQHKTHFELWIWMNESYLEHTAFSNSHCNLICCVDLANVKWPKTIPNTIDSSDFSLSLHPHDSLITSQLSEWFMGALETFPCQQNHFFLSATKKRLRTVRTIYTQWGSEAADEKSPNEIELADNKGKIMVCWIGAHRVRLFTIRSNACYFTNCARWCFAPLLAQS